jgi:hypothetical protein
MKTEPAFTEIVELHERTWGTKKYPGRPSLKQLLNSPIVAVWSIEKHFRLSVHEEASQVNSIIHGLITGKIIDPLNRKLVRIYVNQEPIDYQIKVIATPKAQKRASEPANPEKAPHVSDNQHPTLVSSRPQPQVVGVIPSPTPAFTIPDPMPLSRNKGQDGSVRYGDVVMTPKPVITTPAPDHRHVYVMPGRNPQFSKTLDRRLVEEINKRIK